MSRLLIFSFIIFSFSGLADPFIGAVNLSVDIYSKRKINGLDIVTPQSDFTLEYESGKNKFKVLKIPFIVKSTISKSALDNYSLTLLNAETYCKTESKSETLPKVMFKVDDTEFSVSKALKFKNNANESNHTLSVDVYDVKQVNQFQECQGRLSIMARARI
ncbi:hypothetical protein BTO10_05280 [Vibrio chagasii]|uniref:Uncharacterized protein n=1 Tax=Vibrio chagasii TaxID=170679 RepID=A0A2S7VPX0_9VIBR|nr:hypothetical protein [Vibrio chagasii]PQJ64203.1 hypothetical protein BTO10_05280 [Vibrio chagasii]